MDPFNPNFLACSINVWKESNVSRSWKPRSPAIPWYRVLYFAYIFMSSFYTNHKRNQWKGRKDITEDLIWSPEQDHNGQFAEMGFSNFLLWWWWGYKIVIITQELPSLETAKKTPAIIEGQGLVVFLTMEFKPHPSLPGLICIFFWKPHIEYL